MARRYNSGIFKRVAKVSNDARHAYSYEAEEAEEGHVEGVWHEAVPFKAVSLSPDIANDKTDKQKPTQSLPVLQRNIKDWTTKDFEDSKKNAKVTSKQAEIDNTKKQLEASIPDILSVNMIPQYYTFRYQTTDDNDEGQLKKRTSYLKEQYGKMALYYSFYLDPSKRQLLPAHLDSNRFKILKDEMDYIEKEMVRPLSLSKNYTKLFYNKDIPGLVDEMLKIGDWVNHNPDHPDVERMQITMYKITRFLESYKLNPVQEAFDEKYQKPYLMVEQEISKAELSLLMFGDFDDAGILKNFDGSDPGAVLYPGQPVFYHKTITLLGEHSIKSKPCIKTNGEIDQPVASSLLEVKLSKGTYKIPAHFYKSFARNKIIDARSALKENFQGVITTLRNLSNFKKEMGGVVDDLSHIGSKGYKVRLSEVILNGRLIKHLSEELDAIDLDSVNINNLIRSEKVVDEGNEYLKKASGSYEGYKEDGISGANKWVKWLTVVKNVGEIAGSFIPGVGVLSGLAYDTVSQASEMAFGVREKWDYKQSATQGALAVLNKVGGKLFDNAAGKIANKGWGQQVSNTFGKLPGKTGKLAGEFTKELAVGIALSPFQTMTEKMIKEGNVSFDDIIKGVNEQFSLQNIATTALGMAVKHRGKHKGGGIKKDTQEDAFGSTKLGNPEGKDVLDKAAGLVKRILNKGNKPPNDSSGKRPPSTGDQTGTDHQNTDTGSNNSDSANQQNTSREHTSGQNENVSAGESKIQDLAKSIKKGKANAVGKARELIRDAQDMGSLREVVNSGMLGDVAKVREVMQQARIAEIRVAKKEVIKLLRKKYPDLVFTFKAPGTPKFTSDIDITVVVKSKQRLQAERIIQRGRHTAKDANSALQSLGIPKNHPEYKHLYNMLTSGKLSPENIHLLLNQATIKSEIAASVDASGEFYKVLSDPNKTLDANFYTELHVDNLTAKASKSEQVKIIHGQSVVSMAEMRRNMTFDEWNRYKFLQIRTMKNNAEAKSVEHLMQQLHQAEKMASELESKSLEQVKQELTEKLNDPKATISEIRDAMAKVKLLEPDAYGTHAAVKDVVDHLQTAARGSDVIKKAISAEYKNQGIDESKLNDPDYLAKMRSQLLQVDAQIKDKYGDAFDDIGALKYRASGYKAGSGEHTAFLAQEASANLGKLFHSKSPEAAAKYMERIRYTAREAGTEVHGNITDREIRAMISAKSTPDPKTAVEKVLVGWGDRTGRKNISMDDLKQAWITECKQGSMTTVVVIRTTEHIDFEHQNEK